MSVAAPTKISTLALQGGKPTIDTQDESLFRWPIVTPEDEAAILGVVRAGKMSGIDLTREFEREWGVYQGTEFNLAHCNGTTALIAAMFGVGLGRGDEMIVPSLTYWASAVGCQLLGATPVFADIDPETFCVDPEDIARKITPRTRAIMVVHYCAHPCDMDPIMALAESHGIKVIEDNSHAHGSLYKGRMCGALGHVSAMSMMAAKSFGIGEAGMLCTDDREILERAVAFAHYERGFSDLTIPSLVAQSAPPEFYSPLPLGGLKGRVNQTCSAMGRVQLKYYPERIREIQAGINRFWDLLDGVPGLRAHRPPAGSGSTMGGWYNPVGHYLPEELGGLPVEKFIEAVNAEGGRSGRGLNFPLHLHPGLNTADIFHDGRPTRIAFSNRDVREPRGSLPAAEGAAARALGIPYFKHDRKQQIELYARAWRKVAENADALVEEC